MVTFRAPLQYPFNLKLIIGWQFRGREEGGKRWGEGRGGEGEREREGKRESVGERGRKR